MAASRLRAQVAPLEALPLRVRARRLAAGALGGSHRAERKGSGIEFAGHRPYTPGDDLRHLDRHALLRHGRYMIREFIEETQRARICVLDATASMAFRSPSDGQKSGGQALPTKLDLTLLLGLALLLSAHRRGDPVGLGILDPAELEFPFSGQVVLRDPESGVEIETEGQQVRADYLAKLGAHQARLSDALAARAARYVTCSTKTPAVDILRELFG